MYKAPAAKWLGWMPLIINLIINLTINPTINLIINRVMNQANKTLIKGKASAFPFISLFSF